MSSFLHLSRKELTKRTRKAKKHYPSVKKFFNIFLGFFVVAAIVLYLVQSNNMLTKSYEMKNLEEKLENLKQVRRDLEGKSLELQSMATLSTKISKLKMEGVASAKYLIQEEKAVVKK